MLAFCEACTTHVLAQRKSRVLALEPPRQPAGTTAGRELQPALVQGVADHDAFVS